MALFAQIMARLGLDTKAFDANLEAAGHKVEHFGKHVASHLGAAFSAGAVAYGLEQLIHGAIESGAEIRKFQERLDISAASAQDFTQAAKLAGTDADFFAAKYEKLGIAVNKATQGDEKAIAALQKMGISLEDLNSMSVEEVMRTLFKTIEEGGLTTGQSAAMMDIFGKGWGKLKNIAQEMEHVKLIPKLTEDDLKSLKAYEDFLLKAGNNLRVAAGAFLTHPLETARKNFEKTFRPDKAEKDDTDKFLDQQLDEGEKFEKEIEQRHLDAVAAKDDADRTAWQKTMDRLVEIDKQTKKLNESTEKKNLAPEALHNQLLAKRAELLTDIETRKKAAGEGADTDEDLKRKELELAQVNHDLAGERHSKLSRIPVNALAKLGANVSIHPAIREGQTNAAKTARHVEKLVHHVAAIDHGINGFQH